MQTKSVIGRGSKVTRRFYGYLVNDTDEDFMQVRIEYKNLVERIKLIDSLEEDDKIAFIQVINLMLTKKKILNLITKENAAEQRI